MLLSQPLRTLSSNDSPLRHLQLSNLLAVSFPSQGECSLICIPPQHPLLHLGLSLSPGLGLAPRSSSGDWGGGKGRECVSPDAIAGSLLGPLPPLWVFTGAWIPQEPLEECTDSGGGQHTKLCLLWGQFREKEIPCPPGPHAPWAHGHEKEIPGVKSRGRGREDRLEEGGLTTGCC